MYRCAHIYILFTHYPTHKQARRMFDMTHMILGTPSAPITHLETIITCLHPASSPISLTHFEQH